MSFPPRPPIGMPPVGYAYAPVGMMPMGLGMMPQPVSIHSIGFNDKISHQSCAKGIKL